MNKKQLITLLVLITSVMSFGQAKKKAEKATNEWRYELECLGTGKDGTYLVKVWSYSKKVDVATDRLRKMQSTESFSKGLQAVDKAVWRKNH